jgi:hypothetical protein
MIEYKSVNPCSSTICRPLVTDSLAVEEAMFSIFDIPTVLIPSSCIPQSHDTLRAISVFRCFPPVNKSFEVILNKPVTRSINQSRSYPLTRIIDLRSKFTRAGFKYGRNEIPMARDALIALHHKFQIASAGFVDLAPKKIQSEHRRVDLKNHHGRDHRKIIFLR